MQNLKTKNSIIKLKCLDERGFLKLYCKQVDINIQKELDDLNELYNDFNISHFSVVEINSVNKNYHFLSNRNGKV